MRTLHTFEEFLNESATNCPTNSEDVLGYLTKKLQGIDKVNFETLINDLKSAWSEQDLENVIESEGCESWNYEISRVLLKNNVPCQAFLGSPKDDDLPEHYITICQDKIIDFVPEQFFGYGLGSDLEDDKAVFSEESYSDIKKAYNWKKI
jgi:hypothetical protein